METPVYKSVSGLEARNVGDALNTLLKDGFHLKEILRESSFEMVKLPMGEEQRDVTYFYTILVVKG